MAFHKRVASVNRGSNTFLKTGLPFIMLMVIGSYGLSEFTSTRYEKHEIENTKMTKEQLARLEKEKRTFNMEEEYQRLKDQLDIDNWKQVRMPRPEDLLSAKIKKEEDGS